MSVRFSSKRDRRLWQVAELLGVFVLLPLVFAAGFFPSFRFVALFLVAFTYLFVLLGDRRFGSWRLFPRRPFGHWRPVLLRFFAFALLSTLIVALTFPDSLFSWLRAGRWDLLGGVLLFYPLLSVIPQAIVYRVYFFHRFRDLFVDERLLVVLNAFLFGLLHTLYGNWLAVVLTFFGGFVFAWTYLRSGSLAITVIEHSLYGDWLFLVGIGQFFVY